MGGSWARTLLQYSLLPSSPAISACVPPHHVLVPGVHDVGGVDSEERLRQLKETAEVIQAEGGLPLVGGHEGVGPHGTLQVQAQGAHGGLAGGEGGGAVGLDTRLWGTGSDEGGGAAWLGAALWPGGAGGAVGGAFRPVLGGTELASTLALEGRGRVWPRWDFRSGTSGAAAWVGGWEGRRGRRQESVSYFTMWKETSGVFSLDSRRVYSLYSLHSSTMLVVLQPARSDLLTNRLSTSYTQCYLL